MLGQWEGKLGNALIVTGNDGGCIGGRRTNK